MEALGGFLLMTVCAFAACWIWVGGYIADFVIWIVSKLVPDEANEVTVAVILGAVFGVVGIIVAVAIPEAGPVLGGLIVGVGAYIAVRLPFKVQNKRFARLVESADAVADSATDSTPDNEIPVADVSPDNTAPGSQSPAPSDQQPPVPTKHADQPPTSPAPPVPAQQPAGLTPPSGNDSQPPKPAAGLIEAPGLVDQALDPGGPSPKPVLEAAPPPPSSSPDQQDVPPPPNCGSTATNEPIVTSSPFAPRVPPPIGPGPAPRPHPNQADVPASDDTIVDRDQMEAAPTLLTDDGTPIGLDAPLVIGRNPVAPDGLIGARTVRLVDHSMRLSKTHAVLRYVNGTVVVTDIDSSNGVYLERDGEKTKIPARVHTPVLPGTTIHLGGRTLG